MQFVSILHLMVYCKIKKMKKRNNLLLLFLGFSLLYICFSCVQQKKIKEGINKASKTTFVAKKANSSTRSNSLFISDADNDRYRLRRGEKFNSETGITLKGGRTIIYEIVGRILAPKIRKLQKGKPVFIVQTYPDFDGNVLGVEYIMNEGLPITAEELEQITEAIKKNQEIYVPKDVDRTYRSSPITLRVNFKKL